MLFEKDDPKLTRKRKSLSHYEKGEASLFVSKVKKCYRQFFHQATNVVINCIHNRFPKRLHWKFLEHGNNTVFFKWKYSSENGNTLFR